MSEVEKTDEEPPANEAEDQLPPSSEPEVASTEPEEKQPETEVTEGEDAKRSSSGVKEAPEPEAGKKVDLETFMPPDFLPEKRDSMRSRKSSIGGEPKPITGKRFGPLGSKAKMVLGSMIDIKANVIEGVDRRSRLQSLFSVMSTNSLFGNILNQNGTNDEVEKLGPRYQNTYKLDSANPFNAEKVDAILREVMQEIIENLHYDPEKCSSTAKYASMQIRSKVKQLEFDRYKLVCVVTIGEKNSQDVFASCRFLWDNEKDRYSFFSLENTYVYAIAYCFGLYYE